MVITDFRDDCEWEKIETGRGCEEPGRRVSGDWCVRSTPGGLKRDGLTRGGQIIIVAIAYVNNGRPRDVWLL